MTLGKLIRRRRQELNLSQARLARAVKCRANFISMVENGHVRFPPRKWLVFADALSIDRTAFLRLVLQNLLPGIEEYELMKFDR